MEGSLHNNITHYTIYITVVEKKMGIPSENENESMEEVCVINK